jgi:adenylate cyclase
MKQKERKRLDLSLFTTISFWMSLGISLVVLIIYLLSRPEIHWFPAISILETIEAKTLDLRFHLRGEREPRGDIVIIAVDETTEDALGRWQSSGRQWLARLLAILHEGNAKVIGFDLVLAEPDEGREVKILDELSLYYQENTPEKRSNCPDLLSYIEHAKVTHDYDRQLAKAIQQAGDMVLGHYYFLKPANAAHLTPEKHDAYQQLLARTAYTTIQFPPDTTEQPLRMTPSFGVEPNLPAFSEVAWSFGHFNVVPDRDSTIRFTYLLIEYGDAYYPSLDLEVARAYLHPPLPPIIHALGKEGAGSVEAIEMGATLIPSDEKGTLFINYYGPRGMFPYYSLSEVVLGDIPPYKFADKIVLLGFTSKIYQDLYSVPFQKYDYPGVEIHATIIENIIRGDFLIKPEWATLIETALILVLGIVLGVARHRKRPLFGVWAALIGVLIVASFAHAAFVFGSIWLNVTFPLLFIVVDYLAITSYKYFTEEKQKRGIKNAFQHYVSPTVVTHMLKTAEKLKLGGERKQLTALFSDIRGFTSISEQMSPEALVTFLNEYLSEMTQIVLDHGGTVDKYMGDAIMAFYGAPIEQADHAVRACKTAVDMILRLKQLHVEWEARGLPPMNIGVGINSGEMSVGNMGSWDRFDYTIMGDHVNLASRLEGINKQYGTNIVISHWTYELCRAGSQDSWTVRELDTVRVKGKDEPVTIYELIGYGTLYEQKTPLVARFCEGLERYKNRQWEQAIAVFQEALQIYPDDRPSQIYIERCQEYLQNPPPENWDRVFVMKTK